MTPEEKARLINYLYPISRAKVYPNGYVELERRSIKPKTVPPPKRTAITKSTKKSLHKLAFTVCTTSIDFKSMLTLTYPEKYPTNGKTVKTHLNLQLTKMRYHFEGVSYVWWLEFQQRGAPHAHLITTIQITPAIRRQLAKSWVAAVGSYGTEKMYRVHNHKRQIANLDHPEGAKRYCVKYAIKERQKTVPDNYRNVGRFWGMSRDVKENIPEPTTAMINDKIVREAYPRLAKMKVLPKYIYG